MKFVSILFFTFLFAFSLQAAPPQQYTATITTIQGDQKTNGKIYMDIDRVRVEATTQGMEAISILRPDLKKVFTVIPSKKMYMEFPISTEEAEMMTPYSSKTGFILLGKEKIEGQTLEKFQVGAPKDAIFLWVKPDSNEPVLMQTEGGQIRIEWKDVKVGKPDESLFDVPKGYQKIENPMGK